MGIGCFPTIYPDELIYSVLARYYNNAGYLTYTFMAEDIFVDKKVKPDIFFLSRMKPEVVDMLTREKDFETIIWEHTMFPVYGNVIDRSRRDRAVEAMLAMNGNYNNLLPIQKEKENVYLRYCPCCTKEDTKWYGETYYHRKHQISGIRYCYKHGCKLVNSTVMISGKSSPGFYSAEQEIDNNDIYSNTIETENEIEIKIAAYVSELLDKKCGSEVALGDFLHSRLERTKYLSVRGEQRNIALLYEDMMNYYNGMRDIGIQEIWQLQKIFTGNRFKLLDVCQLAMFLNIKPEELLVRKLPQTSQVELFDTKVKNMHDEGISYPRIAMELGVPLETVKQIGRKKKSIERDYKIKCGTKAYDWDEMDKKMLPEVKEVVKQIYGIGENRPYKVTKFSVSKELGLSDKSIDKLVFCMKEISKYKETQEQYWCRKIVWAVNKIEKDSHEVTWRRIRVLTNMRKVDFETCIPYFKGFQNQKMKLQLLEICEKISI